MKRIILKIGTGVLTAEDGSLAVARLARILDEIVPLITPSEQQLLIVTSGAVGLGRMRLGLSGSLTLAARQACAAIGQSVLIQNYNIILSRFDLMAGQILISSEDFSHDKRRHNLLATIKEMEKFSVVPVINENDVVSTEELESTSNHHSPSFSSSHSFGDNDRLSALLATEVGAELLVILTDSEGIYLQKPTQENDLPLNWVDDFSVLDQVEIWTGSKMGRGGVVSKIAAARLTAEKGIPCWITSGLKEGHLQPFFRHCSQHLAPQWGTFIVGKGTAWKKS